MQCIYVFALFAIFSNFSEKTFLRIDIYDLCIFPQTIFYNNQAELFLKKVFLCMYDGFKTSKNN